MGAEFRLGNTVEVEVCNLRFHGGCDETVKVDSIQSFSHLLKIGCDIELSLTGGEPLPIKSTFMVCLLVIGKNNLLTSFWATLYVPLVIAVTANQKINRALLFSLFTMTQQ